MTTIVANMGGVTGPELAQTFNAASADFERVTPLVWGPAAQALVCELRIAPGERVLDVCSGTGASALAAAMAVGPVGGVHAIDIAGDLLAVAQQSASGRGLRNVTFEEADITDWRGPNGAYDALACSYGVFFLPEMDAACARLVEFVRPGGRIGVTVWRRGALEDYVRIFGETLKRFMDTDGPPRRSPWEDNIVRIDEPASISEWLRELGLVEPQAVVFPNYVPLTEKFAWDFVRGSGMRGALLGFRAETVEQIRSAFLTELRRRDLTTVDASTIVATAARAR
ncbi:class I SAM-dependent methyltransferase [Hoyosella subflava]|uniref:Putative ubiquinone/menaquinone biosynthesis methyltransferase n=1 Tax=Hoyosella subflava (strain DSM 45089 / JCM 17490 / NBRC 109087 / DQS3-9A1) TaxID=443218 RepID=F6EQA1_HOYSD|nr:methyltransferase domain-containing protein [Hoyosella subflava]AEF39524.1 putative ubiquinone/menaquinone biosynthesis methyltransferase [Hoyosella subflava DQS3-9A1]